MSRYVVLKKINEDIEDRNIVVTLLEIGENSTHSFYEGEPGIMFDTCLLYEESDEVIGNVCRSVVYGDILEYHGSNLMVESGGAYNAMYRIDSDGTDSFEKIGSIFDSPTEDAKIINVDGESVIAVRSADGDTYLIYPGTPGVTRIELKLYEEAKPLYGDFNHDGEVNASDATVILLYAAEYGAGKFTGTFEEYLDSAELKSVDDEES
ncbi:MAG: hypothetical protein IKN55_04605 [Oscillospiraceae bacterium]|nr:hypothetical protein [Oscillospiraceae bacterium]